MELGPGLLYPSTKATRTRVTLGSFVDSFNNNSKQWDLGFKDTDYATTKEYIQNGKLCVDITGKRDVMARDTLLSNTITNFDVSVDAYQSKGTEGSDYSIVFRDVNDQNHYIFGINQAYQEYYFSAVLNDEWTDIVDYTFDETINLHGVNTLRVVANGSSFDLYVNSKKVESLTDTKIAKGGEIGVGFGLESKDDNAIMEFDNFNLKVNDSTK
jgi:hypothetical protein